MGLGNESSIKSFIFNTFSNNTFLNDNKSNYKPYFNHSIKNHSKEYIYNSNSHSNSNHSINLNSDSHSNLNHSRNLNSDSHSNLNYSRNLNSDSHSNSNHSHKHNNEINSTNSSDIPILQNKHLIIPIKLTYNNNVISTYAVIDSGATGSFIDSKFVKKSKIPFDLKGIPI